MQKIKAIIDVVLKIKDLLLIVSALIMVVLNFLFSYKLAPLIEADRNADFRIKAVEQSVSSLESAVQKLIVVTDKTALDVAFIRGKYEK